MALIPKRELIVWGNEQLRASLARGVAQVQAGEVTDLDLDALAVPDETDDIE
jgi:hypothetical protein